MHHVVVLNGSIRGPEGNTAWLLEEALRRVEGPVTSELLHLSEVDRDMDQLVESLRRADAFLVGSGVYWHSWGSPLQRFLEVLTPYENTDAFFGKPVGVLVTMDSVGGAEICARLHSVFNQFGCTVPPCSSLVIGRVALEAAERVRPTGEHDPNDDVWMLDDLDVVMHNLLAGLRDEAWRPWSFRPLIAPKGAFPAAGRLDLGSPRFLPPR
ncbi:MAG: NAD(P)H-dependent oxidoreductase [Alphaproteobacteria bacterium]|nr:NAD(P)H-dependent oxidoreductase [Alphaproteobacteria bacterium]